MQLGVSVPYYRLRVVDGTGISGLGDLYLSTKVSLINPEQTTHRVGVTLSPVLEVLGDRPNQWEKQRSENFTAKDFLNFQPEQPITEAGLRNNINVGIHYLGAWLAGNGCVPVFNLMEDAATAEISRSQIWQWMRSPKGVLEDGRKVTAALFEQLLAEELAKVKAAYSEGKYDEGAKLFERITTDDKYVEFLTLPAYQLID